jgi:aminopeptidase N
MNVGRVTRVPLAAAAVAIGIGTLVDASEPREADEVRRDAHSNGRPDQVRVTHVGLDLKVDFERKVLEGAATLTFERRPGAPPDAPLVLDTRGLEIATVSVADPGNGGGWRGTTFSLGAGDRVLGSALTIVVPPPSNKVRVEYRTTDRSSALQWVKPEGTAGGKKPFLFTQSQAIQARSWIPLQDSPGVRVTYEATVVVPPGLTVVMSAEQRPRGAGSFSFEMRQAIPPYLIALAVGDLDFRELGPRTGVYAEPTVVAAAAREFADTEGMVKAAEGRFGAYRWGRYDILVLPPSFPYGGMENARLTFATPTVLAGDRSLVALIAHELSHSWSGNLVTNATWRDFWLNEGFTTYLERRVVEDLYGPDRADMERVLGIKELRTELAAVPARDQVLHIDLAGRDPDEALSRVPYEKGALFLTALERAVGRDKFDPFLRGYFDHFAFRSITTADFVGYLKEKLLDGDPAAAKQVDLRAWLEEPGLPAGTPEPSSDRLARVERASRDWAEGKVSAAKLDTAGWSTHEWIHFLLSLPQHLEADRLAELDRAFGLTDRGNAEVAQQWLLIAVRNRYAPADARLESFLTTIGRRKFLAPLYLELIKTPEGAARARAIYARARPFYHPIAVESFDKLLAKPKAD